MNRKKLYLKLALVLAIVVAGFLSPSKADAYWPHCVYCSDFCEKQGPGAYCDCFGEVMTCAECNGGF